MNLVGFCELEDPGLAGVYISYYLHTSSYIISLNFGESVACTNFESCEKIVVAKKKIVVAYFPSRRIVVL